MQLYSHKAQIHTMKVFMACPGYRNRVPMRRVQKIKFYLFGLLFKLGFCR